jgi:hypothetical protein
MSEETPAAPAPAPDPEKKKLGLIKVRYVKKFLEHDRIELQICREDGSMGFILSEEFHGPGAKGKMDNLVGLMRDVIGDQLVGP